MAETAKEPRYSVGTIYKTRGKHPLTCTVVDIWRTFNAAGEQVRLRYVATHDFAGQTVTDCDVVETSVAMGLLSEPSAIDRLSAEFRAYTVAEGLHDGDAMELLMCDLTEAQRAWLSAFVHRWDAAAESDPAFHDKQTTIKAER